MENTNIAKRISRILKYSNNVEEKALETIREDIGFKLAIENNPKDVLKLLQNCVKKGEIYTGIWDLQFLYEDGKISVPDEFKTEYANAIQELASRLRFVPYDENVNKVCTENLWPDDESKKMTLEEFADRDIINVDESTDDPDPKKT